jgi:predicted ATPase
LLFTGDFGESRAHLDHAFALYDPVEHRALATRFSADPGPTTLSFRSWALWFLGYPDAARADADKAVQDARETGQAGTLMFVLFNTAHTHRLCGNDAAASSLVDELVALADEKSAVLWKAYGTAQQGDLFTLGGNASVAVQTITSALVAQRSTGGTLFITWFLSLLATAHANRDQFDDAWRCIGEAKTAVEATKERFFQPEINRIAGEIALMSPNRDAEKAEAYFQQALEVARQQQAKSWELRASMSLARLWRDQGQPRRARELLASVYGWFTEGFDTRDLKEAKALLDELAS